MRMKDTYTAEDLREWVGELGLTIPQVAALLYTTENIAKKLYYRYYQKLIKKTCSQCGQYFYGTPRSRITICTRSKCKPILFERQDKLTPNRIAKRKASKIREYTDTSLMLIATDLAEGRSLEWIAKMYNRDMEDLKAYVEQIKADGRLVAMQKHVKRMRADRELPRKGIRQLL